MIGSHIDTVATGGRFDGNLGVLAGLEVVETLAAAGVELRRPVQVAFFTDEEGARFPPDMLGSLVYVGGLGVEEALDASASDGSRLGDELARIGYAGPTPCPAAAFPDTFVELHIEQGPVLEDEGVTIGVVTGVQGISWSEFTVTGRSAHAGTTPMRLRRDPMVVAARIIAEARAATGRTGGAQVATVGRIDAYPEPHQRRGPTGAVHARRAEHGRVGAARRRSGAVRLCRRRRRRGGTARSPGASWRDSSRSTSRRR